MFRKIFFIYVVLAIALILQTGCFRQATSEQTVERPEAAGNQSGNVNKIWQITSIEMCSESSGWASTNRDVLRTVDGGDSWQVVTPPVGKGESFGLIEDFVDTDQAWIATSVRDGEKVIILVFQTTDGGRTWKKTELPQGAGSPVLYWGSLTFTSSRQGWLLAVHSQNNSPAELFATADGGLTWSQIAGVYDSAKNLGLPCGGPLSFRDSETGWLVGRVDRANQLLYRTQDGGRTWQEQNLKLPDSDAGGELSVNDPPLFFSATEGLLTATYSPTSGQSSGATILYTTQDGGQTWQSGTPLRPQGIMDFINARDGWNWRWEIPGKEKLYYTTDEGKTWSGIEPDRLLKHFLAQGFNLTELDFINNKTGWGLLPSNDGRIVLLRTTDGGNSWTNVYPH